MKSKYVIPVSYLRLNSCSEHRNFRFRIEYLNNEECTVVATS